MFEAIRANQRRSTVLIVTMGMILLALGGGIGVAVEAQVRPIRALATQFEEFQKATERGPRIIDPFDRSWSLAGPGLWFGFSGAALVFVIMWLTATTSGHHVLLSAANAHPVDKSVAPQLYNVVEEMSIAAGLPGPPRVCIIDDASLNAFAAGYVPRSAVIAVTAGLLKRLSRDELQGVIAHEIGHIKNHDVKFMTLAGVMVGAIALISRAFLRGMGRGIGRGRGGGKGGGAAIVVVIAVIVLAILAPIAAQLLYFATSRRREYLADASAALFTRYPAGLASALEKIEQAAAPAGGASRVVAPMYIVNPLQGASLFTLFSTHPPTRDRIRILRSMGGAGLAAYESAYRGVYGSGRRCLGDDTIGAAPDAEARAASPADADAPDARVAQAAMVGNLLDRVLPFVVIDCPCGVKLKLTPDWKKDTTDCPRCGRTHPVPRAEAGEVRPAATESERPMVYRRRKPGEWESFRCTCGGAVQLAPTFIGTRTMCRVCRKQIEIR